MAPRDLTPDEVSRATVPTAAEPGVALPLDLTPDEARRRQDEVDTSTLGGWGADILRSARTGARSGPEGLAAFPGDLHSLLYDLQSAGYRKLREWAGDDPKKLKALDAELQRGKLNFLPTTPEVEGATSAHVGEHYQPKSTLGSLAKTAASLVTGGAPRALIRDVIAPAIGMQAGGAIGEKIGGEKGKVAGEIIGGVGAPTASEATMRRAIPEAPSEVADRIRTLMREGVELTGGQATGSKSLRYIETGPYEGKPEAIARTQNQQFTRATLRRAGLDADRADPDFMRQAQDAFGQEYEDLINQAGGVNFDIDLQNALQTTGARFERLKGTGPGIPTAVRHYFDRIIDAATQNGGVIPPDVFRTLRKDIAADITGSSDIETTAALREFQDSLFDSVGRASADPTVAARARALNNRYRNFKIVEDSVGGAGDAVSYGYVSPAKLRAAVEKRNPSDYRQGRGDFAELARAGQSITDLPQSGTAGRAAPFAAAGAIGSGVNDLLHGNTLSGVTTLGGTAAAFSLPGILTSRPVSTSIVRRASGEHPDLFNPLPLVPIVQGSGLNDAAMPVPVEPPAEEPPVSVVPQQHGALDMPVPVEPQLPGNQLAAIAMPLILGAARKSTRV